MALATSGVPTVPRPLRLWPGVVAVVVQWLLRFTLPLITPEANGVAILGAFACALVILVWWLFFSRAAIVERIGALVLMAVALAATRQVVDPSISGGMMGMLLYVYAIPVLCLALVASAAASRHLTTGPRRALGAVAILLACSGFTLLRTGGIFGEGASDFHWRWTPTPEERLLAQAEPGKGMAKPTVQAPSPMPPAAGAAAGAAGSAVAERSATPAGSATAKADAPAAAAESAAARPTQAPDRPAAAASAPQAPPAAEIAPAAGASSPAPVAVQADASWSGFRGPDRDSVVHGIKLKTDWSQAKPVELWRQPIGPGWSSFAVHGNLIYTQEQRGEDELVSCYNLATGAPVWQHRDVVRFYESNGGAGPRATPTWSDGRLYTLGATGLLNALDARDGKVAWLRNAAADTHKETPQWGFAGSPLVVDGEVIVATFGMLAAYEASDGHPRWIGPAGRGGYSSPQLATLGGVAQVLLLNGEGAAGVALADGALLWKHEWKGDAIVQPAVIGSDVLLGSGSGLNDAVGTRRVAVTHGSGGWSVAERWTSSGLKPYYNDFVVHNGHAYGFDGSILACIDLQDGTRKWKGGRYGHGQLLVLPDQDLLLVLSEQGELALVAATPDQFTELARFPAIQGKTWNHPVLVGDLLLVRNGQEMAAFRLPVAGR